MQAFLSTPGMALLLATLLAIHACSFVFMGILLFEFRHVHEKRLTILKALGCTRLRGELLQRRFFMGAYVFLTGIIAILSSSLFLWQPHLL